MKIQLICIGKTNKKFLEQGELEYLTRLKHYVKFEKIELPDIKQTKKLSENQIKEKEAEQILLKLNNVDRFFLLDEHGKSYSSVGFAAFLQQQFNLSGQSIAFIVGGPYGFAPVLHEKAAGKISLSEMTFSHQMIRLFFIEQIYRALTILKGEPYHHQ